MSQQIGAVKHFQFAVKIEAFEAFLNNGWGQKVFKIIFLRIKKSSYFHLPWVNAVKHFQFALKYIQFAMKLFKKIHFL